MRDQPFVNVQNLVVKEIKHPSDKRLTKWKPVIIQKTVTPNCKLIKLFAQLSAYIYRLF